MDTATRTSRTRTSLRQPKSNGADTAHRISMYSDDNMQIDYSDPWLYELDPSLPFPKDKEHFTPEEAYRLIMEDIRQIYTTHGA